MPWRQQRDDSLKLQETNPVAKDPRGRHHGCHQIRCPRSRPVDRLHRCRHQRMLPTCRGGHGSPHGVGGPRHHPPGWEVAERQYALLPPHNGKEFHRRPLSQYVRTWRLRAHSAGSRRQLVPIVTQGPSRPLLQGVYGGLVQDKCGLCNINITFLAPSSLLALVDRPPSSLSGIVVVNHFHLRGP